MLWWLITLALTAVRLWLAAWIPLGDDEGYYWVWSRHLAAGYYDHPPLVAWLVALSTRLFGDSLVALRLPFVLCGTLSAVALRDLVRETTGRPRLARDSSLVLQVVPVFFGLGFMVIPDTPLLLFWLLASRALWRLQHVNGASRVLLGLALGGGLLSKYVAALALVSAAGYAAAVRRRGLVTDLLVTCGLAGLLFAPVLWWNAGHDWVSFRYQFVARHQAAGVDPRGLGLFVGSQLLYLSPIFFGCVACAALRAGPWRLDLQDRGQRLLWWLGVPTLGVFFLAAALGDFKPNWPVPAYLTLLPLALLGLERWRTRAPALAAWTGRLAVAMAVAFSVVPVVQVMHPIVRMPRGADPSVDMRGWPRIAAEAQRAAAGLGSTGGTPAPFFAAGRYQLASRLEYYLPGRPPVICLNPGRDAYDDWQRLDRLQGRDFVFVASDRFPTPPDRLARVASARVFARLVTSGKKQAEFGVTIYQCRGFRPRSEPAPP